MNTASGITFYQRVPERPTPYRWYTRWADRWAGRRDARVLSSTQLEEITPGTPAPPVPLTPWAATRMRELQHLMARERITLERVLDGYLVELSQLIADAAAVSAEIARKSGVLDATREAGPASALARSAGEGFEDGSERENRRAAEHAGQLGNLSSALERLHAQALSMATRSQEVRQHVRNAIGATTERCAAHANHTLRRITTYTRGMQRRVPSSQVVERLTALDAPRLELSPEMLERLRLTATITPALDLPAPAPV